MTVWEKCEDRGCCSIPGAWHVGECPMGGRHAVTPLVACLCGVTFWQMYTPQLGDVAEVDGQRGQFTTVSLHMNRHWAAWFVLDDTANGAFTRRALTSGERFRFNLISRIGSGIAAPLLPPWWPQEPLQPRPEPQAPLGLSCCQTHSRGYRCTCANPARLDHPKPDPYRGGMRDAPARGQR